MPAVNHLINEEEYDYYLMLAKILDEGYPSISHEHSSIVSSHRSPTHGISEEDDSTPKECATNDAPFGVD